MRFFLDENVNQQLITPLSGMFGGHEFVGVRELGTKGLDDIALYPAVAEAGCDALITHDLMQLRRSEERAACRDAGLHWLGVHKVNTRGFHALAGPASVIIHGLPFVFGRLAGAEEPRYFVFKKGERNETLVFKEAGAL